MGLIRRLLRHVKTDGHQQAIKGIREGVGRIRQDSTAIHSPRNPALGNGQKGVAHHRHNNSPTVERQTRAICLLSSYLPHVVW